MPNRLASEASGKLASSRQPRELLRDAGGVRSRLANGGAMRLAIGMVLRSRACIGIVGIAWMAQQLLIGKLGVDASKLEQPMAQIGTVRAQVGLGDACVESKQRLARHYGGSFLDQHLAHDAGF